MGNQVVTSENMLELIETGRVADFVAPKPEGETKDEVKAEDKPTGDETKTEAAQQPAAETTEAKKPTDVDDELPEKVQKRINEKHRQMKEAEEWGKSAYLDKLAAEKRVGELEAKVAELEKSKSPAPVKEQAEAPKQEDFATVAEYVDAQVEWKFQQKEAERAQSAKAAEDAKVQAAHVERIKSFAEKTADYDEVLNKADLTLPVPVIQFIRESDAGPRVAYHLSQDKIAGGDLAERIGRMSPIKALAEMGKLEAKLTAPKDEPKPAAPSKQPEVSRAPAPITPIDGRKGEAEKDPAKMSFPELRAHREAERQRAAQKARG